MQKEKRGDVGEWSRAGAVFQRKWCRSGLVVVPAPCEQMVSVVRCGSVDTHSGCAHAGGAGNEMGQLDMAAIVKPRRGNPTWQCISQRSRRAVTLTMGSMGLISDYLPAYFIQLHVNNCL